MKTPLLPLRDWLRGGLLAAFLHVIGTLLIDYGGWKLGFAYKIMAGQFFLLAGAVWFVIVLVLVLTRLRKIGQLDPLRTILWVLGVAVLSAPLKAIGEHAMYPLLKEAYDAYPERRAAEVRAYLRSQQQSGKAEFSSEKIEEIVTMQIRLFEEYRRRQENLWLTMIDRLKVLGIMGLIYGLILGLLLRGGGIGPAPGAGRSAANEGNAG
ncbi:MAG: hypothetical protein NZ580_02125 [Bacteroidia bacterium]|nr:hypothetical protein [Bacteroidia bacterium]MDW8235767.1 hypothetical protein [Bacteroidia bacterium]